MLSIVASQWVNNATRLGFFLAPLLCLSGFSLFPKHVLGASPPPQEPPIKVEITLVNFTAVFVDSKGRRVTDIRADEVIVTDDGEEQKLSIFEPIGRSSDERVSVSDPGESEATNRADWNAAPQIVLVVLLPMHVENRHFAVREAVRYLQAPHHNGARIAVADVTGATLSFTSDSRKIADYARSLSKLPMPSTPWAESSRFRQAAVSFCDSMKTMTGRKSIVLFTDFYKPDNKYIYVTQPWDIYDLARETGVPVYPVDSRGVVPVIPGGDASTSDGSAAAVNANLLSRLAKLDEDQNALAYIASETGGTYVGGNDLSSPFDEVDRDAAASYELAYYKHALRRDGKFHQIKVTVKRPGLHVRVAGGYFAEGNPGTDGTFP